jgi:hypothetical protein
MQPNEAILFVMKSFSTEWSQFQITCERIELWNKIFCQFDAQTILAAGMSIVSQAREFPPPVGIVRAECFRIASGRLTQPDADEAYQHVLEYCNEVIFYDPVNNPDKKHSLTITELERRTLKIMGGETYLMNSNNYYDRSTFVRIFQGVLERSRIEQTTLPEIRELMESKTKSLTA